MGMGGPPRPIAPGIPYGIIPGIIIGILFANAALRVLSSYLFMYFMTLRGASSTTFLFIFMIA